jgi:hypothetical protein
LFDALAFGKEGHEIVASVAFQKLSPRARAWVDRILSDDGVTAGPERMVSASVWPDQIKRTPSEPVSIFQDFGIRNAAGTHSLHYADFTGEHFNPATDSYRGRSVVSGIQKCQEVLASKGDSDSQKREALKFLIHFVGDIHQPLHAGRKGDKGGNSIQIQSFLNRHPAKGFNLHQVWDDLIIQTGTRDSRQYAEQLLTHLSKGQEVEYLKQSEPLAWLEESHRLAVSNAYVNADGTQIRGGERLDSDYLRRNRPVINEQLTKAGVRLAALLERLLQ